MKDVGVRGFYVRKAFRAGPIRFNLSESGLGMSAGVRGARINRFGATRRGSLGMPLLVMRDVTGCVESLNGGIARILAAEPR